MRRVLVYSHTDEYLFELFPAEVFELRTHKEVNGERYLQLTTSKTLTKGMRVLTTDRHGRWEEWVVDTEEALHSTGVDAEYTCMWSVQYDLTGLAISKMPGVQTPVTLLHALSEILDTTQRWETGIVEVSNRAGASMYRMSAWEALGVLVENWGGEVDTTITVDDYGIVGREIDVRSHIGATEVRSRFEYGRNVTSIKRLIGTGIVPCRIIPLGRGEETEDGFGRKITIEPYAHSEYIEGHNLAEARVRDGDGWHYPTIYVENPEMETPEDLYRWGMSVVDKYTTPNVSYDVDLIELAREGQTVDGLELGEEVYVIDEEFGGEDLRLSGRVMEIDENYLDDSDTGVVIGTASRSVASSSWAAVKSVMSKVDNLTSRTYGASRLTDSYMQSMERRTNQRINAGGGYTYMTNAHGLRSYDAGVSDPDDGAEASEAVEVRGGNIRRAATKTGDTWNWHPLFVGDHINGWAITEIAVTGGTATSADHSIDFDFSGNSGTLAMESVDLTRNGTKAMPPFFAVGSASVTMGANSGTEVTVTLDRNMPSTGYKAFVQGEGNPAGYTSVSYSVTEKTTGAVKVMGYNDGGVSVTQTISVLAIA